MPISTPQLVLKGDDNYGDFLDRLAKRAGRSNRSDLAEHAIRELADKLGVKAPERVRPVGWNQHTGK